ncbi:MAG: tRNA uridine(34) 5-carboxymethylaminomethyl modification radical SAM/GNAT enzyme Elp3 [Candidatus Micrarchaeota archaeon]
MTSDFFKDAVSAIQAGKVKNKTELQRLKARLVRKHGLSKLPLDSEILERAPASAVKARAFLKTKPSRTGSGVTVVSVMTKPSKCPHGTCAFCLGGKDIGVPQSYTGNEPASMRGARYDFDAYEQVKNRVQQLEAVGHPTDKIELIIMGGTFTAEPIDYQKRFVLRCYDALNGVNSKDLTAAQHRNETARHRCIGLTVESRPDWLMKPEINNILSFGATRVEIGVQNPNDKIYKLNSRGHTVADVVKATKLCKDSFLKINYHLMSNLPGSDLKTDLKMFKEVFSNEDYKPDMLKIYPCLLVKPEYGQTILHKWYEQGKWKPYTEQQTANLLARAEEYFPPWVRVMRIQRDIPTKLILKGPRHSNLRQYVEEEKKKLGIECRCIRCNEIRNEKIVKPALKRIDYEASGGNEIFLHYENKKSKKLVGFARLRIPDKPFRKEITGRSAGIRELHVYGPSAEIGAKPKLGAQHHGFGKQLLQEAERIAKEEFNKNKMLVISGVGAREYYRSKLGYKQEGPYMVKKL